MEKLTMSRPSALSFLAFSATAMMALGLARPTRLASWGITVLASVNDRWGKPRKDTTPAASAADAGACHMWRLGPAWPPGGAHARAVAGPERSRRRSLAAAAGRPARR